MFRRRREVAGGVGLSEVISLLASEKYARRGCSNWYWLLLVKPALRERSKKWYMKPGQSVARSTGVCLESNPRYQSDVKKVFREDARHEAYGGDEHHSEKSPQGR
jgi:hypothetical protein